MLRRPRRFKFQIRFKCKSARKYKLLPADYCEGGLQSMKTVKLSWKHFEMMRLKLTWNLMYKSRGSRKSQFKKKIKRRRVKVFFKAPPLFKKKRFWYQGFPHLSYSIKSRGSRMGRGHGLSKYWYQLIHYSYPLVYVKAANSFKLYYILSQLQRSLPGSYYIYIHMHPRCAILV
jgi:ribosomal protein L16/L10AE